MADLDSNKETAGTSRGQWTSNIGFILAAAGSAIGLGNLWKFPYLAGQYGGAAFVFVYLIALLLIGYPIMLGEMSIGRAAQLNAIGSYRKLGGRSWTWVGVMGIVAGFLILSFYSVIGGWVLYYIFEHARGLASNIFQSDLGGIPSDTKGHFGSFISNAWHPIFWHLLFMLGTAWIVLKGVAAGIEKYSKIMMPCLFLLLIVVLIRSVTLNGSEAGITYYIKPDFSKITPEAIIAAVGQVFFSLSLGMGCMITYGSYLAKKENLQVNTLVIPSLDTLAALLAGFAIMPAVFAFGLQPGQGPGLMFITLPQVFQQMPAGNFFGLLFFILIFFAAITSSISLLEVISSYFIDQFKWKRSKAVITMAILLFFLGIPCSLSFGPMSETKFLDKTFFDWLDYLASNIMLPLGGLLMCIFIGYFWKVDNAAKEISSDGKYAFKMKPLFAIMMKVISPIAVLFVFFNMIGIDAVAWIKKFITWMSGEGN